MSEAAIVIATLALLLALYNYQKDRKQTEQIRDILEMLAGDVMKLMGLGRKK